MADQDDRAGHGPAAAARPHRTEGVGTGRWRPSPGDFKTVEEAIRFVTRRSMAASPFSTTAGSTGTAAPRTGSAGGSRAAATRSCHDQGLHSRPRRRPGHEDARRVAAPLQTDHSTCAVHGMGFDNDPELAYAGGRASKPWTVRRSRARPASSASPATRIGRPPGMVRRRLPVRHGADAAQLPGRDLSRSFEKQVLPELTKARHCRAGHEADGGHGHRRQERPVQGGGNAALRDEPAVATTIAAWIPWTCLRRTCASRAASKPMTAEEMQALARPMCRGGRDGRHSRTSCPLSSTTRSPFGRTASRWTSHRRRSRRCCFKRLRQE